MPTYLALLRGINVGRAKQVSMADLRAVFEACGYSDVTTVLRSGNVLFTSAAPLAAEAGATLEAELLRRTQVPSSMLLLAAGELQQIADDNPLLDVGTDPSRLLVAFTSAASSRAALQYVPEPERLAPEVLVVGERAIYHWCPDSVSASQVPASFWRAVAPVVTVRNWRTVTRLVTLATGARRG